MLLRGREQWGEDHNKARATTLCFHLNSCTITVCVSAWNDRLSRSADADRGTERGQSQWHFVYLSECIRTASLWRRPKGKPRGEKKASRKRGREKKDAKAKALAAVARGSGFLCRSRKTTVSGSSRKTGGILSGLCIRDRRATEQVQTSNNSLQAASLKTCKSDTVFTRSLHLIWNSVSCSSRAPGSLFIYLCSSNTLNKFLLIAWCSNSTKTTRKQSRFSQ